MGAPVKTEIIYYRTASDFELEFNLNGCCAMRLLSDKTQSRKEFYLSLCRAVSRNKIIFTVGSLSGETSVLFETCRAIGYKIESRNLSEFGLDVSVEAPEKSLPLVSKSGKLGGFVIECGVQAIIILTDDKDTRKAVMRELVHHYMRDIDTQSHKFTPKPVLTDAVTAETDTKTDGYSFDSLDDIDLKEKKHKKHTFLKVVITVIVFLSLLAAGSFSFLKFAEPLIVERLYSNYRDMHQRAEASDSLDILDCMKKIYNENNDTVGYLSIGGISLNTPVVTTANREDGYYDRHLFDGKFSYFQATPYTDDTANDGFIRNRIIYGKKTFFGGCFDELSKLLTLEGYRSSPIISYDTLHFSEDYVIFSVFTCGDVELNSLVRRDFNTDAEFVSYLTELLSLSEISANVNVYSSDNLITLVSRHAGENTVIVARAFRDGELQKVDTSSAVLSKDMVEGALPSIGYFNLTDDEQFTQTELVYNSPEIFTKGYELAFPVSDELAAQYTESIAATVDESGVLTPRESAQNEGDLLISVKDHSGEIKTGTVSDLLPQIVAAQMDDSFETEAIKAQAIASYSWLLTHGAASGEAPFMPLSTPSPKIVETVKSVIGLKAYFGAHIAQTYYHKTSAGSTASAYSVFGINIPYLCSVDSSADRSCTDLVSYRTYRADDICLWVKKALGIDLGKTADKGKWFNISYSKGKTYTAFVSFGDSSEVYRGSVLREHIFTLDNVGDMGGLLSSAYRIIYQPSSDTFVFEVRGNGCGVGLSQTGANAMAVNGLTYTEILSHYFTDITINY